MAKTPCPYCGRLVDRLIEGMCEDCYVERHPLVVLKERKALRCKYCGAWFLRGKWMKSKNPTELFVRFLREKGSINGVIEKVELDEREEGAVAQVTVRGSPHQLIAPRSIAYEVAVEYIYDVCTSCRELLSRRALMSMGFVEVSNYVLTDRAVESLCKAVYVANPISELYNAVRCSIVTQLIATASTMRRREVKLFEVGDVVREGRTLKVAAFLISRDGVTLTDGLSVAKTLCSRLGLNCKASATEVGWALQNRAARIEGDVSGYVAEANPDLLTILGHLIPTVVGELVLG